MNKLDREPMYDLPHFCRRVKVESDKTNRVKQEILVDRESKNNAIC